MRISTVLEIGGNKGDSARNFVKATILIFELIVGIIIIMAFALSYI